MKSPLYVESRVEWAVLGSEISRQFDPKLLIWLVRVLSHAHAEMNAATSITAVVLARECESILGITANNDDMKDC